MTPRPRAISGISPSSTTSMRRLSPTNAVISPSAGTHSAARAPDAGVSTCFPARVCASASSPSTIKPRPSSGAASVAFDRADPAFLRAQHGDRLALDERCRRDLDRLRRAGDQGAAAAERRVAAEFGLRCRYLLRQGAPLPPVAGEQCVEPGGLGGQRAQLLLDRDLLEP